MRWTNHDLCLALLQQLQAEQANASRKTNNKRGEVEQQHRLEHKSIPRETRLISRSFDVPVTSNRRHNIMSTAQSAQNPWGERRGFLRPASQCRAPSVAIDEMETPEPVASTNRPMQADHHHLGTRYVQHSNGFRELQAFEYNGNRPVDRYASGRFVSWSTSSSKLLMLTSVT